MSKGKVGMWCFVAGVVTNALINIPLIPGL